MPYEMPFTASVKITSNVKTLLVIQMKIVNKRAPETAKGSGAPMIVILLVFFFPSDF